MLLVYRIGRKHFYPRPPRGGRHQLSHLLRGKAADFYPRPPRGGRQGVAAQTEGVEDFYPRPPRGGRHAGGCEHLHRQHISIHALREEGDCHKMVGMSQKGHFYPRPPRGGRLTRTAGLTWPGRFLSTPSARRATSAGQQRRWTSPISIHALREEGDCGQALCC